MLVVITILIASPLETEITMTSDQTDPAFQQFLDSISEAFAEVDTDRTNREVVPEGQRPCPICHEPMTSAHEKGVLIDLCEEHGMWLDKDELRAVLKRSQESETVAELKAKITAEKETPGSGNFLLGFVIGSAIG